MKLIYTDKEFDDFYFFKSKPTRYPKQYPCVVKMEDEECGVAGYVIRHYVAYIPMTGTYETMFLEGCKVKWEYLC